MNLELEKRQIIEEIKEVHDEWVLKAIKRLLGVHDESEITNGNIENTHQDEEQNIWRQTSTSNFLKGYGENEPDYTDADIKEPNPEYKKWKEK